MEIVVQQSLNWTLLLAAGAGLGGALIGATAIFLLEFWRQLLTARSAARIIRMELQNNANLCLMSIAYKQHRIDEISDKAWTQFGIHLAPLLPEQALLRMSNDYGALFIVGNWMQKLATEHDKAKAQIIEWLNNVQPSLAILKQMEERRRLAQFFDLLLGRTTFPPGVVDDKGGTTPSQPSIDEIVKDVQRIVDAEANQETDTS